jgi:hypothetical protein
MTTNPDKREAILARLLAIGVELYGAKFAYRNEIDIPEGRSGETRFVLMDSDENAVDPLTLGKGRPPNGVQIVGMTPEIYLLMQGKSADIGTDMNTERRKVLKAILNDATLSGLCHNGDIRYEGYASGLSAGREMNTDCGLSFTFVYALFPSLL